MDDCYICHNDPQFRKVCSRPHIHELKIWTIPFEAVLDGSKRYEVRKADRPFLVGDDIILKEYIPEWNSYTGREIFGRITYITEAGMWGLPKDICVFGFKA